MNQKARIKSSIEEFKSYFVPLVPGLFGAFVGVAYLIVFSSITLLFEVGPLGMVVMALYAGGCGGFIMGRQWERQEKEEKIKKQGREQ